MDLTECCAIIGRHSVFKDKYTRDIARLKISEIEMLLRNEKEYLNSRLKEISRIQDRLNNAKICLIKKKGYP